MCKHVALNKEAYKLFTNCVALIHAFVNGSARAPSALDALDSFVAEMDVYHTQEHTAKACKGHITSYMRMSLLIFNLRHR